MDYKALIEKLNNYKNRFNVTEIGNSFFGRKIFAVEKIVNSGFQTAIFLSSIHARENITTDLVCKMIDSGLFDEIKDFNISFILMTNPDGVELCKNGITSVPEEFRDYLLKINNFSYVFSLWKANGRGVDINNNFDARFGTNVNSTVPAPSGFVGEFAESEPETKAVVNYTKKVKPFITLSYHSKGEEIYYNFFQTENRLVRDKQIAERFSRSTGYQIKNPERTSSGGFKDYCVEKLKIPALTIEVGSDNLVHPISEDFLDEIFEHHKNVAKDLQFAYNLVRE